MLDQFSITTALNPFDITNKEVNIYIIEEGKPLSYYVEDIKPYHDTSLVASINGEQVFCSWDKVIPQNEDIIIVAPNTEAEWVFLAIYVITMAACMYTVMNMELSLPQGAEEDITNTYGWGELKPTIAEGNPIPIVFGKDKLAGQIINQFTETDEDNKEFLFMLLGLCDGELDSIDNILINEQPVGYYRDIETYTRMGTLDDTIIPGFGKIVQQHAVTTKFCSSELVIKQTDGNSVNEIVIVLSAPGLYYQNELGGLETVRTVHNIYYRVLGAGSWIHYCDSSLEGATTSKIFKTIRIPDLSSNAYEIAVSREVYQISTTRTRRDTYFDSFQEVIYEKLTYPGVAKYAFKMLATDQFSGARPKVSCIVHKNHVSVYDTDEASYVWKIATNPAWASYALLNTYHGVSHERLIYEDFEEWADYCDEIIGGEARFTMGISLDQTTTLWKSIQKVAAIGRGKIIMKGTKFGVFVDKPSDIVSHLFNVSNIIENSFKKTYIPKVDIRNAVEITYKDPDRDYTTQVVGVYSSDYKDTENMPKKASINIEAAIPRAQAIREGAWMLNSNKHLKETIEFKTNIESITCIPGDIIYFQHYIPDYGGTTSGSIGGRVVSAGNDNGSGDPYIVLDQEVEILTGTTYGLLTRLQNDTIVEKTVKSVGSDTTTDTLLFNSSWVSIPQQYDIYQIGKADTYKKKYRITDIVREQDFTTKVTCIEYVLEVYNDDDYVIEDPSWETPVVQEATFVIAREFLIYGQGGDYESNVAVSWSPTTSDVGSNWTVWLENRTLNQEWLSDNGGEFEDTFVDGISRPEIVKVCDTTRTSYIISSSYLTPMHEYRIYISANSAGPIDTGSNTAMLQILGKLAPPEDVLNFIGTWNSIKRVVNFGWTIVNDIDISHYEIRQGNTWDGGEVKVKAAIGNSTSIPIVEGTNETITYWIKAVDTSDVKSLNAYYTQVNINTADCSLEVPTGLFLSTESTIANDGTDRVTILATWDNNAEVSDDFSKYNVRLEVMSNSRIDEYTTRKTQYQWEVISNTQYGVTVQAEDISTNETSWCAQELITSSKDSTPPSDPTSLSAEGTYNSIILTWSHGAEADLNHFIVYRNGVNNSATSSGVGNSVKEFSGTLAMFNDTPPTSDTYYYWVKAVDSSNNVSGFSNSSNADAPGAETNIAPGSITETEISDDAISTPKLQANSIVASKINAGEIGTNHLVADAVTAGKIDVSQLDAISANCGTLNAGVLNSSNWSAAVGTHFDLNNEIIQIGGSSNPQLSWNGTLLVLGGEVLIGDVTASGINGWAYSGDTTKIDGGNIYAGSSITIGNADGISDYCEIDAGDISFYYYFGSAHHLYKSLKRQETGVANSGSTVNIPGYWKEVPIVSLSPRELMCYNRDYSSQSQVLILIVENLTEYATGQYNFIAKAQLELDGTTATAYPNLQDSCSDTAVDHNWTWLTQTATYDTPNNTIHVTVNGNSETTIESYSNEEGCYIPRPAFQETYVYIDGAGYLVAGGAGTLSHFNFNFIYSKSLSSTTHTIYIRSRVRATSSVQCRASSEVSCSCVTNTLTGNTVLTSGTLNWTATGE